MYQFKSLAYVFDELPEDVRLSLDDMELFIHPLIEGKYELFDYGRLLRYSTTLVNGFKVYGESVEIEDEIMRTREAAKSNTMRAVLELVNFALVDYRVAKQKKAA